MTRLTLRYDREDDGRWIASVVELSGVHAYGATKDEARRGVFALALRTFADEIECGERDPMFLFQIVRNTK